MSASRHLEQFGHSFTIACQIVSRSLVGYIPDIYASLRFDARQPPIFRYSDVGRPNGRKTGWCQTGPGGGTIWNLVFSESILELVETEGVQILLQ